MPHPESLPPDPSSTDSKPANDSFQREWLRYAAPVLLLALVSGLLYRDGFAWLSEIWSHNDYSHGYLVPLISLYIAWEQRERFRLLPIAPAYPGAAAVIFTCLLLLLVSRASAVIQLEAASLFLIIPGILLLLFGLQITRAALVPWLYLSFALPWFDLFVGIVQLPFQRVSAIFASKLLNLLYPVYLDDIFIHLPSISMEVAKECSGVNFFISVLAIGIPLVYFTQRTWSRSILVLCLGLLITMLANGLRIAIAGIMGEIFGPALLHGPAHILQGWFVAWFGWAGLFVVNWLVVRKSDAAAPRLIDRWKLRLPADPEMTPMKPIFSRHLYTASAVLALCFVVVYFLSPRPVSLPTPLSSLPKTLSGWKGAETQWIEQSTLFPDADEQLERKYSSSGGYKPVAIYIAYFNKQTAQKRLIRHFSQPLYNNAVTLTLPNSAPGLPPFKVNRTTLVQNGIHYDVFFWYQFPVHKTVTGQNQARLTALKNGISLRRNNGAAVLVAVEQGPAREKEGATAVPESISAFLKDAGAEIAAILP